MQVDGEPVLLKASELVIGFKNQANMLSKEKGYIHTCVDLTKSYVHTCVDVTNVYVHTCVDVTKKYLHKRKS